MPYSLRSYQQFCVDRFMYEGRQLTLLPFGTGKTVIAAEQLARLRIEEGGGRYLVVCAKNARSQWLETLNVAAPGVTVHIYDNVNSVPSMYPDRGDIVLTHWDMLIRSDWLLDKTWTLVVLDEVHRIRNPKRKRSKAAHQLKALHRIGLTGSHMDKQVDELWNILKWMDKRNFNSRNAFVERYCTTETRYVGANRYQVVVGAKNMNELAQRMKPFTVSMKLNNLDLDNLPPLQTRVIHTPLLPKQQTIYEMFSNADDILVDDQHIVPNALTKMLRCQQISVDPSLLEYDAPSAKLEWLNEWIEDLDHQAVVFTRFRDTAIRIATEHNAALVVGGVEGTMGISRFKAGDFQLLVATIDAMSESVDLPNADTTVFLDSTWSSLQMEQAKARVYRPAAGGNKTKTAIYLVSSPVDELVADCIERKLTQREIVDRYLALVLGAEQKIH